MLVADDDGEGEDNDCDYNKLIIMTEIILITIIGSCKKLWLMLVAAQKGGGWGSNQVCGLTANQ